MSDSRQLNYGDLSITGKSKYRDIAVTSLVDVESAIDVASSSLVDGVVHRVFGGDGMMNTSPRPNEKTNRTQEGVTFKSRMESKLNQSKTNRSNQSVKAEDSRSTSEKSPQKVHSPVNDEFERLHFQLLQDKETISDLQDAIRTERTKSLEWMKRHNEERDCNRLAQAELEDMHEQLKSIRSQSLKDQEDLQQIEALYKSEQSQVRVLEKALAEERENFRRLKNALDQERTRSREACDRDSDAILDLRNALELQREMRNNTSCALSVPSPVGFLSSRGKRYGSGSVFPSASTGNIPGRFRSLTDSFGSIEAGLNCTTPRWQPIDRLQKELDEERGRVEALKSCLEQERQKYDKLAEQIQEQHSQPLPVFAFDHEKFFECPDDPFTSLHQEVSTYHERRIDTLEAEKVELERELDRAKTLIEKLRSDKEALNEEVEILQVFRSTVEGDTSNLQRITDVEKTMEARRRKESTLKVKLSMAKDLIQKLQRENQALAKREIDHIRQISDHDEETPWDSQGNLSQEDCQNSIVNSKIAYLMSINQSLNEKITDLQYQVAKLKRGEEKTRKTHNSTLERQFSEQGCQTSTTQISPTASDCDNHNKAGTKRSSLRGLRLETQRRALIWQKKYLMLLLSRQNEIPRNESNFILNKFRVAALCVVAVKRLDILSRKWKQREKSLATSSVESDELVCP